MKYAFILVAIIGFWIAIILIANLAPELNGNLLHLFAIAMTVGLFLMGSKK